MPVDSRDITRTANGLALLPSTASRLRLLISNRAIPIADTFRLLEIWSCGFPSTVRRLEEGNALLPLLMSYACALRAAGELAIEHPHLSDAERFELAGLPLSPPCST